MGLSEFYGATDDKTALLVLDRAFDLGVTFFDTADMYGHGHNERLLSQFLQRHKSNDIKIATKFGISRDPAGGYARSLNNSPEYIRNACEASLKRLSVEHIDLYYVHRVDQSVPIEETVGVLSKLVADGKIGHVGLCEVSTATLRRAHAIHPVTALQTEYSLWTRDIEVEMLPVCRQLGVGVVAYSPLGRGFLTGRLTRPESLDNNDFRRLSPRFDASNFSNNLRLLTTLEDLSKARGVSPGQIAIAWLLSRGEDIVPIPGTKRLTYLEENISAAQVTLRDDEMRVLDEAFPVGAAYGDRYPLEGMKGLNA